MIGRYRGPTVLAVHGFDGYAARDCREFAPLAARLHGRLRTVGFYRGDTHADVVLPGGANTDTSIAVLGEALAGVIEDLGVVDLVGHSMGGLVVQSALGVAPAGSVRRVVMLGVPFHGLPSAVGTDVVQCREMSPGSAFLARLADQGLRADLAVGSEADEAVPIDSALVTGTRRVRLPEAAGIHHGDLLDHGTVIRETVRALGRRAVRSSG